MRHRLGKIALRICFALCLFATALLVTSASHVNEAPKRVSSALHRSSASDDGAVSLPASRGGSANPGYQASGPNDAAAFRTKRKLSSSFDHLASSADSGNSAAACVLSRELIECKRVETEISNMEEMVDQAARTETGSHDETELTKTIVELESKIRSQAELCDGLSDRQKGQADDRVLQAARLGVTEAMVEFALFAGPRMIQTGNDERIRRIYVANVIEMLDRSASNGNIEALRALFRIYFLGMLPDGSEHNNGKPDVVAAAAIGDALLQSGNDHDKVMIHTALDRIASEGGLSSDRYRSLKNKYSRYANEIQSRRSFESNDSLDSGCGI